MNATIEHDAPGGFPRQDLERYRLAATTILDLAEDDTINAALETELYLFRDQIEGLLLRPAAGGDLPPRQVPAPGFLPAPVHGADGAPTA